MPAKSGRRFAPLLGLLFQAGIVALALVLLWMFPIPVTTDGLTVPAYLLWGSLGAVATYGALLLMSLVDALSPDTLKRHIRDLHQFVCSQSWAVLICLAVLAGVGEELLFRGVIQGWVTGQFGSWAGILAGALAFGLAHALSLAYFLVATALGVVFGVAYSVSDSIQLVMVWHAVYDLVVILVLRHFPELFGLRQSGAPSGP